jgi:D-alanyl-D-alanine carboxypeptidase
VVLCFGSGCNLGGGEPRSETTDSSTATVSGDSTTSPPPSLDAVSTAVKAINLAYHGTFPGSVVLARLGDEERIITSGLADLGRHRRMQPDDRFQIGSVTKMMVAALVMQLVESGHVSLSDKVDQWLPDLLPQGSRISVEELLSHRSGLYNYTDSKDFNWDPGWTPRELVRLSTIHDSLFAPGSQGSYSNTNYIVLGMLVEEVTSQPIEAVLEKRIFAPADMQDTSMRRSRLSEPPLARGYDGNRDVTLSDLSSGWAAGGVASTAADLDRFLQALFGGRLVSMPQVRDMMKPRGQLVDGGFAEYGLAVARRPLKCGTALGHNGGLPGYATEAWLLEGTERSAVVLVNDVAAQDLALSLLTAALCT